MATAADALSRDWVHRAKEAGNEAVQRLEQDAGECLMDCCAKYDDVAYLCLRARECIR